MRNSTHQAALASALVFLRNSLSLRLMKIQAISEKIRFISSDWTVEIFAPAAPLLTLPVNTRRFASRIYVPLAKRNLT